MSASALLGCFLQLPANIIGWGLRVLGITDRPNIVIGASGRLETLEMPDDPRILYKYWWHLGIENRQREGFRSGHLRTQNADECTVKLQFVSATRIYEDAGMILGRASEFPGERMTLYRNEPTYIPVYFWAFRDGQNHPFGNPYGWLLNGEGVYISGAKFMTHPELSARQRIDPGDYKVMVTVTWNDKEHKVQFDLHVSEPNRTNAPDNPPQHSALRVLS